MKIFSAKGKVIVFMVLIFSGTIKSKSKMLTTTAKRFKVHVGINFETEVKRFCEGKPKVNFCSKQQIEMMLKIERQRLETLELARQLKRIESEITKKVSSYQFSVLTPNNTKC